MCLHATVASESLGVRLDLAAHSLDCRGPRGNEMLVSGATGKLIRARHDKF